KTPGGVRPSEPRARLEGNVITAWPTKLALVPQLAKLILDHLGNPPAAETQRVTIPPDWPRAGVAVPPWEQNRTWHCQD
ncbi:MAG: hypothetical protein ACYS7M_13910, partial [Planctomycetota bacterium]